MELVLQLLLFVPVIQCSGPYMITPKKECWVGCGYKDGPCEGYCGKNGYCCHSQKKGCRDVFKTVVTISTKYWCVNSGTDATGSTTSVSVDENWGEWTTFSVCTVNCGGGEHFRTRLCTNPPAAHGGMNCLLSDGSGKRGTSEKQKEDCNQNLCPVDGVWDEWRYTRCSVTCGTGTRTKLRRCKQPTPQNNAQQCLLLDKSRGMVEQEIVSCEIDRVCPAPSQSPTISSSNSKKGPYLMEDITQSCWAKCGPGGSCEKLCGRNGFCCSGASQYNDCSQNLKDAVLAVKGADKGHYCVNDGKVPCQEDNINYAGDENTISTTQNVPDWRSCSERCRSVSDCMVWSWYTETHDVHGKKCHLRKAHEQRRTDQDVISGPRSCRKGDDGDQGNGGEILYIAIAVAAVVVLAIVVLIILFWRKKRQDRAPDSKNNEDGIPQENDNYNAEMSLMSDQQQYAPVGDFPQFEKSKLTQDKMVYAELGPGGGRVGDRMKPVESNYAEVRTEGTDYPPLQQGRTDAPVYNDPDGVTYDTIDIANASQKQQNDAAHFIPTYDALSPNVHGCIEVDI